MEGCQHWDQKKCISKMCSFKKEHAFSNRSEWNISDLDIEEEKESQQLVLIGVCVDLC